jgi:hypothetical protein
VEGSDDAPTIISRPANRAARADDNFAITLRGRKLAHFELLEAIGVGGMAAVIRARDTQLDRTIALKILPPEMAVDIENVRRFHQEARAAARLDHENIARVFFCGEDQGLHFIAFEFVEGENLRTILERRGPLPVPEAVHYMLQIATGLAHSSSRGVVHRDIKPSNIIISANGRAKLVDMGLARSLEPHGDNGLTQSGVTLGTFDYISPEQALEPRDADVRSDIYSLGCTFYHMLTARPPVPEGTAAKKLHHHHHVPPVDPRQLNPDISDEVAAVLARMMAKDPRYRYQRAEHLVQHLLQLAHKLGATPEMPEGVLYVDTPLPGPPRMRPVLVAAAAAFFLIALIVLHGMAPWSPPPRAHGPRFAGPNAMPGDVPGGLPPAVAEGPSATNEIPRPAPQPPASPPQTVATAGDLADALRLRKNAPTEVLLAQDINLNTRGGRDRDAPGVPGLVLHAQGRNLIIQPDQPQARRTVQLRYDPDFRYDGPDGTPVWTALTIKGGGHVTLRRIRFEVNATQAPILMAAIKAQDGANLTLEQCEFVQADPPRTDPAGDPSWLSSLVVTDAHARLKSCYFGTRENSGRMSGTAAPDNQEAIALDGSASVTAESCAFGPHTTLFQLRKGHRPEAKLTLVRCSSLLKDGSVFQLGEGLAAGRLVVHGCLFSHVEGPSSAGGSATLIQQIGGEGRLLFEGSGNRYHNLDAFWTRSSLSESSTVAATWEEFQRALGANGEKDQQSLVLAQSPWAAKDPLDLLKNDRPDEAFPLDVNQRELRVGKDGNSIVGIDQCVWGKTYVSQLPLLSDAKPRLVSEKYVIPNAPRSGEGVYRKLSLAIGDAQPGDVIYIQADGPLPVEPVKLDQKTASDLTLKAAPDCHPILTMGETSDPDAALFRVYSGKLRLEGLEFYLRPSRDEVTSQAVAEVIGDGQCVFKNCVATLEDPKGKPLALVTLTDSSKVMRTEAAPPPQQTPRVHLENCFVRGQGDLMAVRASRSAEVKIENSLITLAGSFLNVESNAKDAATAALVVKLTHVTAYLSDNLVRLRSDKDGTEPVPIQVNPAVNCLFASADGKALVHLDGLEVTNMKHLFSWEGGKQNAYSKFQPMLDQQPKGDEIPLLTYDQQRWKSFTGEPDGLFLTTVKFADPPNPDAPLAKALVQAQPEHFKVKTETAQQGYGADVSELPKPSPMSR